MITKMKKIAFLVYHKEYNEFLNELGELGMIHIAERKDAIDNNKQLEDYRLVLKKLNDAERTLSLHKDKKQAAEAQNKTDIARGYQIPSFIEEIEEEKNRLTQQIQVSKKERDALLPWGNFNPESIKKLEQAGYNVHFFVVQENAFRQEWEDEYNAIVVSTVAGRTHFITITRQSKEDVAAALHLETVQLPDAELSRLDSLIDDLQEKYRLQDEKLATLANELPSLEAAIHEVESKMTFVRVKESAEKVADEKVMVMQGWAPAKNIEEITRYLQSKNAYFEVSDPQPEDDVPIQLSNNKFFKLFEPITNLYMLPKYNELDLTPFFAPFFMIFFGLSLGDIGYGLFLFVVATAYKIIARKKISPSVKSIMTLVQFLGASTFFTGLLTGGFFGVDLYKLDNPIAQTLRDKLFLDSNKMFSLALILGVIQVIFGMCLKAVNRAIQFGFVYALSTIGWIVLLLSFIITQLFGSVMPMFSTPHLIIVGISAALIFFVNSPGKNIFLNIGLGLWDAYNMATGLLGDILSYVRLFALGLSGGILASVFTSLATGMSPDIAVIGPIFTIVIFVFGHAINIFMNTLGAIVHPMRLTFVEFFKNSEFTGGGQRYQPFKN